MSDLIVYCVPKPFHLAQVFSQVQENCSSMTSFNESKAKDLMFKHQQAFQVYHQSKFSRIYPDPITRVNSSNFNPIAYWLSGAQLVAMNCQTACEEMQVNQGWFLRNANSGWILKPECLRQEGKLVKK